jgi:Gram-negative bacterial TonB protein C-terminal
MKLFFACSLLLSAQMLSAQALPDSSEKRIFDKVEQEAEFPGGIPEWIKFLTKRLVRFNPADNGAPIGKYECMAQFIVTKDGTLNNITMLTQMGYGMEEEAKKCLLASPKWIPAVQNGKTVNAYRRQPITFMVEDDDIDIQTKIPYTLLANEKNWVTISVRKVKPENLRISIDDGPLLEGNEGDFMINPAHKKRINFTIYNAGRKNAVVGKVSLTVMAKK